VGIKILEFLTSAKMEVSVQLHTLEQVPSGQEDGWVSEIGLEVETGEKAV
jgi:hypothetical protein